MSDETPKVDSIVSSVIHKFEQRAVFGKNKYGTDLDRKDLHFLEWVQHYQEELMDAILYLEKMKITYNENNEDEPADKHIKKSIYKWCEKNPGIASKIMANIESEDNDSEDDEILNTIKSINDTNKHIFKILKDNQVI